MDRTEKLKMLNNLFAAHDEMHAAMDGLYKSLNPDPGCALYDAIYAVLDIAVKATASAIGDKDEWLDWMIHENECGKRGHEAGYINATRPIRTAEDLLDLIEEGNRANSEQ